MDGFQQYALLRCKMIEREREAAMRTYRLTHDFSMPGARRSIWSKVRNLVAKNQADPGAGLPHIIELNGNAVVKHKYPGRRK